MKIFIDTANVKEIEEASTWGIVDGVTTNPSLIAKEGKKLIDVIKKITSLIDGPISAEVSEGKANDMVNEAFKYARLHQNIVIKLPFTIEGLKACKILTSFKIKTNVTLVFSLPQAVLAAKAGATYVSPFLGRLDDLEKTDDSGYKLVKSIHEAFKEYGFTTQIISASIRHVKHVEQSILAGSDVATIPFKVLKDSYYHLLTEKGLQIFAEASKK
ncbi:MAG: fructose-6-phosphate aldolase [Bacillales bacterium]|jgi:transaldolase|nr:fructose-6-phosphate aldolase [Bacillales bacterium]